MFRYEPETQGCTPAVIVRLNSLKKFPYFICLDHTQQSLYISK